MMDDTSRKVADRWLKKSAVTSPYTETVEEGIRVVQADTDNQTSKAKITGNKLLILWGKDAQGVAGRAVKTKYFPKWVKWAVKHLTQKAERVEEKKEWERTTLLGYSVYDIEGKGEVARILQKIDREVQPILKKFNLSYQTLKESVAEGSLGFNRGAGRVISLNVRQKRFPMKLRKFSAVMATMIHELAHIRHMNHGPDFKQFEADLMDWARKNFIYVPG